MVNVGPAVGIGKDRIFHAEILGAMGHHCGKASFGAIQRQGFGNDNAGIIAG